MNFTMRTASEILASQAAFAEALKLFRTGDLSRDDLLSKLAQELASGASAADLLKVVQDAELISPLPPDVHEVLTQRIKERQILPARAAYVADVPTIVLQQPGETQGARSLMRAGARRSSVSVGDVLQARFRLVELIGEGGMSRVYKALDLRRVEAGSEDPYLAVKILSLPFNEYFGSIAALQNEAQKLQSLAHPNIVRVFDCDRDGEIVYMTMEYLAGSQLLAGHPARSVATDIGQPEAESIIVAMASALEYAHGNHIVHGDLKPGNVLITEQGRVKVIDFGISRWFARPEVALDRREAVQNRLALAATARYASPQVIARQLPQPADDVYALSCLAYLLLTGIHPFANDSALNSKATPPQLPGLTMAHYAAILKGLQFERQDRSTVREFIEEFSATPPARSWKKSAMWLSTAAIAILAGWFMSRRPAPLEPAPASPTVVAPPAPAPLAPVAGAGIRDCPTCPLMTILPTGQFKQGSADGSSPVSGFEQPQHLVSIGYVLAMSPSEITVGDFREFIAATGRDMRGCDTYDGKWRHRPKASWQDPGFAQGATHPVTCASWSDAVAYANWLSAKSGHRYRLPTSSEWEFAARAGDEASRPWKSNRAGACEQANVADQSAARRYAGWDVFACNDGYVNTAPVASFKANAFGLYDMLGNVLEWTEDCWHADYAAAPIDGSARVDGDCTERELRGASWFSSPAYVTTSYRNHFAADYRASSIGFRLVREISP